MNDQGKKEDSWVRRLLPIIVILSVLIFVIAAYTDHNQYNKMKEEQSELTGQVTQTGAELDHLKEASGSLADVTKKMEAQKQQIVSMKIELERVIEEKSSTEAAISMQRQKLSQASLQLKDLNEQVLAGKNNVAELTKDIEKTNGKVEAVKSQHERLLKTAQGLEGDIVNKKSVLDSIEFLQRQRPMLEQKNQNLRIRNDIAAEAVVEKQAKLDALQNKIKEGTASLNEQSERTTALSKEFAELTEAVKKLSLQKETLVMLGDHQKNLEYLEKLQQQKESMEVAINSLLLRGKVLEEENLKLQQSEPVR